MNEMNIAQTIKGDQKAESVEPKKGEGKLTIGEGEHSIYPMEETAEVSRPMSEMLEEFNLQPKPELSEMLGKNCFTYFPKQMIDQESEIQTLSSYLQSYDKPRKNDPTRLNRENLQLRDQPPKLEKHRSLFSLARSVNSSLNQKGQNHKRSPLVRGEERSHIRTSQGISNQANKCDLQLNSEALNDLDYQENDDQEGHGQSFSDQQKEQKEREQQGKKIPKLDLSCATKKTEEKRVPSTNYAPPPAKVSGQAVSQSGPPVGIGDLYVRFIALMARILGQAEAEAHSLYNRIKRRTDAIDTLTTLLQKINNEGGEIDWSKNPEMRKLIDQVRDMGVEIPEGKYSWTKEEVVLLKENIQMRKDSMEKITQLERTDMQRFLQEASQCHQARSNVLKLLKEVMDTIIHNMRGA